MAFKTRSEKTAYKKGLFKGLRQKDKPKNVRSKKEKPVYLGKTCVNGEYWDTNFKKPYKFTKAQIKEMHKNYDPSGTATDAQVVDRFCSHMRRKFGTFDKNTGAFLGLLGDD